MSEIESVAKLMYENVRLQQLLNKHEAMLFKHPDLRDQFAMAAMTGMLAGDRGVEDLAKSAYKFADFMLEARKEK